MCCLICTFTYVRAPIRAKWHINDSAHKLTGLPDFGPELVEELVAAKVVVVPGRPFWTDTAAATNSGMSCEHAKPCTTNKHEGVMSSVEHCFFYHPA